MPTDAPRAEDVTPKELIFVLDTSGSMYGMPMDVSKRATKRALEHLHPRDTFAVLRYSDNHSALSPVPLANTPANVDRALKYVAGLQGEGGTDVLGGARAAFAYPHEDGRLRIVVFMTDGFIGNESELLREIRTRVGATRLFAVGIGSSVNRYLIHGMAEAGRGAEMVVTPRDNAEATIDTLFRRVDSPYLTDVDIDWNGLAVAPTGPLPDVFAGQPLVVYARYHKGGRATVEVRGKLAGKPYVQRLEVALPDAEPRNQAIATLWARREIDRLTAEGEVKGADGVEAAITDLALEHQLMTRYTSFVAVEERMVAEAGGPPRRVEVPNELPEGVSPDRIFGGELSLERFQPGDPEIRIFAPAGARQVTVVFPFGETKTAAWDPRVEAWTARFLVPRGTPEGTYAIHVLVTLDDGARRRFVVPYAVDSGAARFDLALARVVGGEAVLEAVQVPTDSDAAVAGRPRSRLKAQVIADVTRLAARLPDGTVVELAEHSPGRWRGKVPAPAGTLHVVLTSVDMAGNKGVQKFDLAR